MIWIIGNKGMLGTEVQHLLEQKKYPLYVSDREVNITDIFNLQSFIANKDIKWIINCSAYTAVDQAEDDIKNAYAINAEGVKNIAHLAKICKAKLIHISTDYVFNGEKSNPYQESDMTNPIGVYGSSKLSGEQAIIEIWDQYFILRTSWLFGKYGKNFITTILRYLNEKKELNVVSDQSGCPTFTKDLAELIYLIIDNDSTTYGIYHFSNEGTTTWYDFSKKIQELGIANSLVKNDTIIHPIPTSSYPTRASRPKYSALNKDKVKETFKIDIRRWENALAEFMSNLNK